MAEENKIILDADVKPLKKQLREATLELQNARQKFGELSTEAVNAAKKVAGIRDSIEDANEQAQQFDPGKRFQALTTAASTAAGGIAAAQGALALFGSESKDVEKALLKVQGAMALSQGLSQLKDIGKVGDQLTTAFKGLTAGANGFKKALISTGIGALVVAVGLLVAYWDDILALVGGVSKEQKKLNEATQLDLQAQTEKLDAIDGQANQLKLQGKTEAEILDLKIAQTAEAIMAAEVNLENAKATKQAQIDASKRNQEILAGLLAFLSLPITAILGTVDLISSGLKQLGLIEESTTLLDDSTKYLASFVFDPEKVAEEGDQVIKEAEGALNKLKEQSAGFTLSQQEAQKAAGEKSSEEREKQRQKEAEDLAKANEEKLKMLEKQAEDEKAFQKQLNDIRTQTRLDGIKDENEKARQQILNEFEKQRQEILENDRLTSEQRTILKLELATQEQQALAAFQQTLDEANAIKEIEKLDAEMVKAENDFNLQKDLLFQKQALIDSQYAADLISQADYNAATEANTDARIDLDKKEKEAKMANASQIAGLLGNLSNLVGKETAAGKAFAVASATIDTYLSANKAYQSMVGIPVAGPALAAVAAGVAVAGGIANVRKIMSTKVPGGGGGGVSAPSISAAAPAVTSAVPTLGTSPVTALGQMMQNQPPIRAYVVESEVTGTQKRVADIERRAGF
jgi:tRNA(Leu) C34 or U34 (ribose-2'-O)-methylase TrmL